MHVQPVATRNRNPAIDSLKALLAALVVAHHAFLAYTTSGYGSMVVEPRKFVAFDFVTGYLDLWFMSLFFFLSGLFVGKAVDRKGAGGYALGRLLRLGLPYVIGVVLINVPAFFFQYWAWLEQTTGTGIVLGAGEFLKFWGATIGTGQGQLWFL